MDRVGTAILGAIVGGFTAAAAIICWFGWGVPGRGQSPHLDPTRADYVDLLLAIATIFLGAVGLAVTVGALVIGLVALKTLREIKDEAASAAKDAAAAKINKTIAEELEPNVNAKVQEALPTALSSALLKDELAHKILTAMAQRGELDEVLERVVMRTQAVEPEDEQEITGEYVGDEAEPK
jgi:hypothetical protein